MRASFWLLIVLFSSSFSNEESPGYLRHRLIVLPASKISIKGKTNVNQFTCAIPGYTGKDTLVIQESGVRGKPFFIKGFVGLPANEFDCGMGAMTHDFNKTIKAREYPVIGIDFKSFERMPEYTGEEKFKGTMAITIAGVSNIFEVMCTLQTTREEIINLKGGRSFGFSDFQLKAPSRMMGMVKVDETLVVNFHLVLKLDDNRY